MRPGGVVVRAMGGQLPETVIEVGHQQVDQHATAWVLGRGGLSRKVAQSLLPKSFVARFGTCCANCICSLKARESGAAAPDGRDILAAGIADAPFLAVLRL